MSQTKTDTATFRTIPFLEALSEGDLERIAGRSRLVSFQAGDAIVERGDRGCTMYIVVTGNARIEVGGRYHDLSKGDLVGEMSVLSSRPRMATVKASAPLQAIEIDCGDVDTFLRENPALAIHMLKVLVERLREVQDRLDSWMGVYVP